MISALKALLFLLLLAAIASSSCASTCAQNIGSCNCLCTSCATGCVYANPIDPCEAGSGACCVVGSPLTDQPTSSSVAVPTSQPVAVPSASPGVVSTRLPSAAPSHSPEQAHTLAPTSFSCPNLVETFSIDHRDCYSFCCYSRDELHAPGWKNDVPQENATVSLLTNTTIERGKFYWRVVTNANPFNFSVTLKNATGVTIETAYYSPSANLFCSNINVGVSSALYFLTPEGINFTLPAKFFYGDYNTTVVVRDTGLVIQAGNSVFQFCTASEVQWIFSGMIPHSSSAINFILLGTALFLGR
jgi:hypothetical protein